MDLLGEHKIRCQKVEVYNPFSKKRHDLFGIIDVLAMCPLLGIVGIQACGASDRVPHIEKLLSSPASILWVRSGGRLQLWTWRKICKLKKDGKKSKTKTWTPKIEEFELAMDQLVLRKLDTL